jgi:ELWxxDGT repeat protein
MVKDLNGEERSSPLELAVVGDKLFFTAIDPDDATFTVKTQLWVTDGTELGTQLVFEEPGASFGYSINNLTVLGTTLMFTAPTQVGTDGISFNAELHSIVVPEPASVAAIASAALLVIRRRRGR